MTEIIVIGIIVSLIFYELTGISPGGIIVPGIFVLYLNQIDRVIYTVIISILSVLIVRLISKYIIIYGKRRFVVFIVVSILLNLIVSLVLKTASNQLIVISIIGYLISGIIANEMYKQSIRKTLPAIVIVVIFLQMIVILSGGKLF